jgi:hypothetical protein
LGANSARKSEQHSECDGSAHDNSPGLTAVRIQRPLQV